MRLFYDGFKEKVREVYKERNLDIIQEASDRLIQDLQELDLSEIVPVLDSIKDLLLADFENENDLLKNIDTLFLDYYRIGLEIDFIDLL